MVIILGRSQQLIRADTGGAFQLSLQNKPITLDKQLVTFKDLGNVDYKEAWDYQEKLLQENVQVKAEWGKMMRAAERGNGPSLTQDLQTATLVSPAFAATTHYFLVCEHPPVYTIGKSGNQNNVLISEAEMIRRGIQFYPTNRGGDITFHGPGQVVGYPILDLEKLYTDIGKYLRALEEVIILTIAEYGIHGERSAGETGVWIQPGVPGKERKICAMGVRCSRWITMHGFALNVNTDLSYFNNIVPCGIKNKQVTSIEKELGRSIDLPTIKDALQRNFAQVFEVRLV